MQLDEDSQKLTAFTIPGKDQFHWITSTMGLLGCPASFQRLMEGVLGDIPNVLVYIDDLLVHTDTHEKYFHVISYASRQLKDHEMNYSPFLLEAAAAVWGINFFNEFLKGK
jgi:hypothetical protein